MSDFLAEARILVRPDTSGFRALLEAELRAVTATPITIPVIPIAPAAGAGLAGLEAVTASLTATTVGLTAATEALVLAMNQETASATRATAAQTSHAAAMSQLARGAASSGLTLFGLRGATLAASGAFLAGTAAVVAFAKSIQSAAAFETQLNVFEVTAGATADEMLRAAQAAQQLGRDLTLPGVTAGDAAESMTELAKAGLSVEDSLNATRGVLQLATAAQIENVEATGLVAGALNSFGLAGTQAVKVADLLTGAAQESQGSISDMGTALAQASAVAKLFGVSIEDTFTLLTQLARAGIAGGRAGTSLRVAFLRLVNPTGAAATELEKLNVQIRDAAGNLRPEIFTDITQALSGYSKGQREATLATIFGSDAIRTAGIIGQQGAAAFESVRAAITEQGLAAATAGARTRGFQGDIANLSNQAEALGLTLGERLKGPVGGIADVFASAFGAVNDLIVRLGEVGEGTPIANQSIVDLTENLAKLDEQVAKSRAGARGGGVADIGVASSADVKELVAEILRVGDGLEVGSRKFELFVKAFTTQLPAVGDALRDGIVDPAEQAELATTALGQAFLKIIPKELLAETALNDGVDIGVAFAQGLRTGMVSQTLSVGATARSLIEDATREAAQADLAPDVASAVKGFGVPQLENILEAFDAQEVRARIKGDNEELLDVLNREQTFLEKQLNRQFVQNRPKLRNALERALLGATNDIESIQDKARSERERIAREGAANATKAEQNLLAGFATDRDVQQNKIAAAALKAGLKDDIQEQKDLAGIVREQIKVIRDRISLAGGQRAAIAALNAVLNTVDAATKKLRDDQAAAQAQQRQNLLAGIRLDIQLAEINENQNAEVKRRNRLIDELNKDLKAEEKAHGKTTLLYKQIRNQIAQETAAINAITAEKKKENNAFATASFEFLQSQQGFASSLLGNLIPSGATSGLVGGSQAPVQVALQPVAGAAEARASSGPTGGQSNATNHILVQILGQLKELNGETKAPEARRQRIVQYSVMDGAPSG